MSRIERSNLEHGFGTMHGKGDGSVVYDPGASLAVLCPRGFSQTLLAMSLKLDPIVRVLLSGIGGLHMAHIQPG